MIQKPIIKCIIVSLYPYYKNSITQNEKMTITFKSKAVHSFYKNKIRSHFMLQLNLFVIVHCASTSKLYNINFC